jgi:hypothetical protein
MKLLWIATKSPWPPVDGGRLLLLHTLRALAARDHRIVLLTPAENIEPGAEPPEPPAGVRVVAIPAPLRPRAIDLAAAYLAGEPWTVRRHRRPAVAAEAARLAAAEPFDGLIAEQLQAVALLPPASPRGSPRVMRAQNVESELWRGAARFARWSAPFLRREARRLEIVEGAAARALDCTVALTAVDGARIRSLAGPSARVEILPAPFPVLPDGRAELAGSPAVTLFASAGWAPNRDATRWFVGEVWPQVLVLRPEARLHVFGGEPTPGPRIEWREAPRDSAEAFSSRAIFVVPLRAGSGVRMKILEAWARGVPVVSTPQGAAGLELETGRELLLAASAESMAAEIARLAADADLASALVASGRVALRRDHDPAGVAAGWESLLGSLAAA